MAIIAFLDTNVVRDLAEERTSRSQQDLAELRGLIESARTIVAPSFEVLDELLSSPDLAEADQLANAQFYDSMVDWHFTLKPSDQMLQDDVISLARNGGPAAPYCAVDAQQSGFIQAIRQGRSILPLQTLRAIRDRTRKQNARFVKAVFTNFDRRLPDHGRQQLRSQRETTWNSWWRDQGLADLIARDLDVNDSVPQQVSLLTLPSVRMAVGYILDTWYHQVVGSRQVNPTQHHDFRIAVLGGGVGRIVTHDRRLRKAIEHIPQSVPALTIQDLLTQCFR